MTTTHQSLELGPIVGHTDHESSRIWVRRPFMIESN